MSKSVSNDALWEKLSEISGQLNSLSPEQKTQVSSSLQVENAPDFSGVKDEIIAEIKDEIRFLGKHSDVNFGTVNQNFITLDEIVRKVWSIVSRIRKQQIENTEQQLEGLKTQTKDNREYFNLRFFKLRKTHVVITVLGFLVFILTLFCMKQQNDYSLLLNEYYQQGIELRKIQMAVDSLRVEKPVVSKKKK